MLSQSRKLCKTIRLSNVHWNCSLIIEIETSRTVVGSEFQINGAEWRGKLRFPYLIVLHRGSTRFPWAAERRWRRVELVDTVDCRQGTVELSDGVRKTLYIYTDNACLNSIRSGAIDQIRSAINSLTRYTNDWHFSVTVSSPWRLTYIVHTHTTEADPGVCR